MNIQKLGSNETCSKGLYFTKRPNIEFNKSASILRLNPADYINVSEKGVRYLADNTITKEIKERFASIPFIKNLVEQFDTFIFFKELPMEHPDNLSSQHLSIARISWLDDAKNSNELRLVSGNSAVSKEFATDKMFINLKGEKFSEIA